MKPRSRNLSPGVQQALLQPAVDSPRWGGKYSGPMPSQVGAILGLFDTPPGARARMMSVVTGVSANVGQTNAELRLRVTMGVGGQAQTFDSDLQNGCQFSLVADTLRVQLVSYAPSTLVGYNPNVNGQIIVSAGAVLGTVPGNSAQCLTYTTPVQLIAAAGVLVLEPPPFARRYRLLFRDPSSADWALATDINVRAVVGGSGGTVAAETDARIFRYQDSLPIPAGCTVVTVGNNTANPIVASIVWSLGL